MAKRGETRPWRMTYLWPSLGRPHTETFARPDQARDAARAQAVRVGGQSGARDCLVHVSHRGDGTPREWYRACPRCGELTTWDTDHLPVAWRHVDNDSRWCTAADGGQPVMPPGGGAAKPEVLWARATAGATA